ncbi:MAG TPA: hypothetical protein VGM90_16295 [Kofleriaceae bacterium]|jgi:hypothetical protein
MYDDDDDDDDFRNAVRVVSRSGAGGSSNGRRGVVVRRPGTRPVREPYYDQPNDPYAMGMQPYGTAASAAMLPLLAGAGAGGGSAGVMQQFALASQYQAMGMPPAMAMQLAMQQKPANSTMRKVGQVIKAGAPLIAAFRALPAPPPVATYTGDAETDTKSLFANQANALSYTTQIAQEAKSDETWIGLIEIAGTILEEWA